MQRVPADKKTYREGGIQLITHLTLITKRRYDNRPSCMSRDQTVSMYSLVDPGAKGAVAP